MASAAARGKRGRDVDAASVASSLPAPAAAVGTRVVVGGSAFCEISVDFWSAAQRADSRKYTGKTLKPVRAVLAVPAAATPRDLLLKILEVWQWDDHHLFELEIGGRRVQGTPMEEVGMCRVAFTDDYKKWPPLASLVDGGLALGQKMKITYDFGDNWQWGAKVTKVHAGGAPAEVAVVSVTGVAPKQYGGVSEEEEEEEEEEGDEDDEGGDMQ